MPTRPTLERGLSNGSAFQRANHVRKKSQSAAAVAAAAHVDSTAQASASAATTPTTGSTRKHMDPISPAALAWASGNKPPKPKPKPPRSPAAKKESPTKAAASSPPPFETIILNQSGEQIDAPPSSLDETLHTLPSSSGQDPPSLISALCYKGLETLVCTARSSRNEPCITIVSARARTTLQSLVLEEGAGGEIVAITTNPTTGLVGVVLEQKIVHTFYPVPASPNTNDNDTKGGPVTVFGKYVWVPGRIISCSDILVNKQAGTRFARVEGSQRPGTAQPIPPSSPKSTSSSYLSFSPSSTAASHSPPELSQVHVATCRDWKVLLAHADQLAMFDVTPSSTSSTIDGSLGNDPGTLIWTKRVGATIVDMSLSGDGRAIAYVLEGEGVGVPYPFGVRTFVRDAQDGVDADVTPSIGQPIIPTRKHSDDASGIHPPPVPMDNNDLLDEIPLEKSMSRLGILYKPGPFLVHSTTVTRVSFRGDGTNNSTVYPDEETSKANGSGGNDLLLTACSSDGSMRVFSQGSWKLLLRWDTPAGSRADWIDGVTMANLGDLDPYPKTSRSRSSRARANSEPTISSQDVGQNNSGMIGRGNGKATRHVSVDTATSVHSVWQSQPVPSCASGAWIMELTFRGPFPALRLSRLSFMRSGEDSWAPAHFESVAAILPPATILPGAVLQSFCGKEGMGMAVQGIWPAWNPWEPHPNASSGTATGSGGGVVEDENQSGNAMALLGAMPQGNGVSNASTASSLDMMNSLAMGGTHAPPSELRLVASHPDGNKVVIMEFPLWGDSELGAMELGSPLRYLLSLKEDVPLDVKIHSNRFKRENQQAPLPVTISTRCASLDFESNGLCAVVSDDRRHIRLTWRAKGTMNILASESREEETTQDTSRDRRNSMDSIASTVSVDSRESQTSYLTRDHGARIKTFQDWSSIPLPLSLPSLHLPLTSADSENISLLKWWPDENFGGPPRLFALTTSGTLILYEMPPPWSALEPVMPMDDPFSINKMGSYHEESNATLEREGSIQSSSDEDEDHVVEDYDVNITPHPDFGLGLRLEAQASGMAAVAGSFKKHPLTGGRLPAEKTGKIILGDELISVNDVSLEGLSFDDIISSVRLVGSNLQGEALVMKFRSMEKNRLLFKEKMSQMSAEQPSEQGLEVVHQKSTIDTGSSAASPYAAATVLVGGYSDMQQEFGRVIAMIQNALPSYSSEKSVRSLVLLPWHYGKGAPTPYKIRGATLLVSGVGRTITASRLEVFNGHEGGSRLTFLGSIDLKLDSSNVNGDIISLEVVKTGSEGWCVACCDVMGTITFVFIDVNDGSEVNTADAKRNNDKTLDLHASFRAHNAFNCFEGISIKNSNEVLFRAHSIELVATMPVGINCCDTVKVWCSSPFVAISESEIRKNYAEFVIKHHGNESIQDDPILDFRWIASGSVDAFPWLVTFSRRSAVVHRRPGGHLVWAPIAELNYPNIEKNNVYYGSLSPADAYPHLIPALRFIITASDERQFLLSDWYPESILASVCTDSEGVKSGLKMHVSGLFEWLSNWMDPTDSITLNWDSHSRLVTAPFQSTRSFAKNIDEDVNECCDTNNAASLMSGISTEVKPPSNEKVLLSKFQTALLHHLKLKNEDKENDPNQGKKINYSREFMIAMNSGTSESRAETELEDIPIPDPLKTLDRDDICFLWAMGEINKNHVKFGTLDEKAQLTLFCLSLLRKIKEAENIYDTNLTNDHKKPSVHRTFLFKPSSTSQVSSLSLSRPVDIASVSCLSALVSDSQIQLLKLCRKPGTKLDWDTVREMRLPFWLRSDKLLKKISEEVAQTIYKNKKDIVECALFFIAVGNMKMLKALALTDRSEMGRKFSTFVTSYDFASSRGRKAAEKNAYSLLRKRRYIASAAFFLLAKPPMLKSAVEIIVTKMEDISLAFLVSRLVESQQEQLRHTGSEPGMLTIGGSSSLLNMGSGGGFASVGAQNMPSDEKEDYYSDWKPSLKASSIRILTEHGIKLGEDDPSFQAIQFIWMNRPNDGAMCLLGKQYVNADKYEMKSEEFRLSSPFKNETSAAINHGAKVSRVALKANFFINITSRPLMLKYMKVHKYMQWYSALHLSRALSNRGIELPALAILPALEDTMVSSNKDATCSGTDSADGQIQSEIMGTPKKTNKSNALPKQDIGMVSSIFETFDAPLQPTANITKPNADMSSSIFDSFDAPIKPKPVANITKPNADMSSSIFDSFDAPIKSKPVANITKPNADMSSSIFDSFDAPMKPKQATNTNKPSADMSSSIFDSFDTPSTKQVTQKIPSVESKESISSILNTFESALKMEGRSTKLLPPLSAASTSSQVTTPQKLYNIPKDSAMVELSVPMLWLEWRSNILTISVARRLLREMARIIAQLQGDARKPAHKLFRRHIHPLVSYDASHVLQEGCDGEAILSVIFDCLEQLSTTFKVPKDPIIEQALLLLSCPHQPQRVVFAVLLHCLTGRADLAEDVMRDAAHDQMQRCQMFINSNDDLIHDRKTKHHASSQYVRRQASIVSWQLELCLWLQRGGTFPMSPVALKETTIGVRVGLIVASWGRCHECLENMIKCEPDCVMSFERGRLLWSSIKDMMSPGPINEKTNPGSETTSGGWEFLVDCNREESTELLRNRKKGTFLLRPHPDDHGVFTLSFRTNLKSPTNEEDESNTENDVENGARRKSKRDEVVQHAIVRLSDAGFRCGSFGPFSSLLKLLEAVSTSLPFDLLFSDPPAQGIIKEEGGQPSPNSVFIRKLALHSKTEHYRWNSTTKHNNKHVDYVNDSNGIDESIEDIIADGSNGSISEVDKDNIFGLFSQLLILTELRKQMCAVVAAPDEKDMNSSWAETNSMSHKTFADEAESFNDLYFEGSLADSMEEIGEEELDAISSRTIRPFLSWCRSLETSIVSKLLPDLKAVSKRPASYLPISLSASDTAVEAMPSSRPINEVACSDNGDAIIRKMIQPTSGVEFRTLRVGEAGHSAVVVLFSRSEALSWMVTSGTEKNEEDAASRLSLIEKHRVIEQVDLHALSGAKKEGNEEMEIDKEIRYRFVDPWEVEVLESKDAELRAASLGRGHFVPFTIGSVAKACEDSQRKLGGLHLLALWSAAKGGVCLTKSLASVHPPWERDVGGDIQVNHGIISQSSTFENSLRQHIYRNILFHRLNLPHRFLAVVQVELLDLKNLTSVGPSLTAYALLRLKRDSSNAPLTHKARTIDSASTVPRKIQKISGPNAPASWGSLVRFRFPLPEDINCDGVSFDRDREALFKGAPSSLQISVYEKKFMNDIILGGASIKLDGLSSGGQVEEWVPLKSANNEITWFTRIRLTLRFELMCLESDATMSKEDLKDQCPSAGLRKLRSLSHHGGAQEGSSGMQHSISTPDIVSYFESIVS